MISDMNIRSDRFDWSLTMPTRWQMQQAKARFAELVRKAGAEGPQVVTYRGVDMAIVLSVRDYRRLQGSKPSLVDHILGGPRLDDGMVDLINERPADRVRDIDL